MEQTHSFWMGVWRKFSRSWIGVLALSVVLFFALTGLFAPFLASSQPLAIQYDGVWYFPLFRYLFYSGFFTKRLDIFFNLLMFVLPVWLLVTYLFGRRESWIGPLFLSIQAGGFLVLILFPLTDPASDPVLNQNRQQSIQSTMMGPGDDPLIAPIANHTLSWRFEQNHTNHYGQLQLVLRDWLQEKHHERLQQYAPLYEAAERDEWLAEEISRKRLALRTQGVGDADFPSRQQMIDSITAETDSDVLKRRLSMPTLWQVNQDRDQAEIEEALARLDATALEAEKVRPEYSSLLRQYVVAKENGSKELPEVRRKLGEVRRALSAYEDASTALSYVQERRQWLEGEKEKIGFILMPALRWFHWEDDAGGEQDINSYVSWWDLTRINRKDLVAGLLFGVRISMVVGITAISLALIIGIPIGALAGYFGGKTDIVVMRLMEIWESMPSFFMLLMVVAITQSKSIFLVIAVIGIFGWTGFSRFIRGEVLKQRHLPYVEACHAMGFRTPRIVFSHILPNAIPPLLTLLPFAIMGAITSEAGLSFLGLGEEGSCSWGVFRDEGRTAFPGESYLLWPPAIMLTMLLVAIALVGDSMRDALDPKS